jgi:putative endonuclease
MRCGAGPPLGMMGIRANRIMRWSVYLLRCGDGSLYTGITNDLDRRIAAHSRGTGAAYTRSRLPVALVFHEPAADRGAALRREAALKRLPRAAKLLLVSAPRRRGRGGVLTGRVSRPPRSGR